MTASEMHQFMITLQEALRWPLSLASHAAVLVQYHRLQTVRARHARIILPEPAPTAPMCDAMVGFGTYVVSRKLT